MTMPAARLGDMHTCPMADGPKPHVGGPIVGPGVPSVMIGGSVAAVAGDEATCVGPPDKVVTGSTSVLIGNKPPARIADATAHGGVIMKGDATVLIGNSGGAASGQAAVFQAAAGSGRPFVEVCAENRQAEGGGV